MVLENFLIDVDVLWDRAGKELYEKPDARAGRKMRVRVTNKGLVEDLTGYALNLGWRSTIDETKFGLDAFTAVDITKGIFELPYTSGMLTNIGTLVGTLQLVPSVGTPTESNNFMITVKRSGVDVEAVQSENSFTALTTALLQVQNLESTYAPELLSVKQQLADNQQKVDEYLLSKSLNVRYPFGTSLRPAKGDGVTDDTAAIQAIIDYVSEQAVKSVFSNDWNQRGGGVYLPAGTYMAGTLYLKEGIILKGHSVDSTKILSRGTVEETYAITNKYQGAVDGYRNVSIENLSVDGNGIYLLKGYNSNVRNVSVYNGVGTGVLIQLSVFTKLKNVRVFNFGVGIEINGNAGSGPATTVYADDIWISQSKTGLIVNGGLNWIDTVHFEKLIIEYCDTTGFILGGVKENHGISLRNLHLEQNGSYLGIQDSSIIIENVYCDNPDIFNIVILKQSKSYKTTVTLRDIVGKVFVQADATPVIHYDNVPNITDNGMATYYSTQKTNIYKTATGEGLLSEAYKSLNRKTMETGTVGLFDLLVTSTEGHWVGKALLNKGNSVKLIPNSDSNTALIANSGGTVTVTSQNTNTQFQVKQLF